MESHESNGKNDQSYLINVPRHTNKSKNEAFPSNYKRRISQKAMIPSLYCKHMRVCIYISIPAATPSAAARKPPPMAALDDAPPVNCDGFAPYVVVGW